MTYGKRALVAVLACLLCASALAMAPRSFDDPVQQRQYEQLLTELRCLVCQNETLGESEASLAEDLRREVAEMVRAGHSNAEIKAFLVARYGDFVLYRPTVKPLTYALWFGPAALLLLGLGVWLALTRHRRVDVSAVAPLSEAEHRRARALLDDGSDSDAP